MKADTLSARLQREESFEARYFMHLRDGTEEILDPEGIEMSQHAIVGMALKSARDCIAGDAHQGVINLKYRIDVHDESGKVVHSLAFLDAVEIVRD